MADQRRERLGIVAGNDDGHVTLPRRLGRAHLGKHHIEHAVDAGHLAQDHARAHGLARVATDHMRGCRGLDLRQARRSGRKRAGAKCQTRRDDAADKGSVRIDDLDIGRRAQVDHDARRAVDGTGRHGIGDAVGADLGRVVVVHGHAGLEARPHGEHAPRAGTGKSRLPRALERRHHAAQHGSRGHKCARHARIGRQRGHNLSETHTHFVGRNARRRRNLARRKRALLRRGRILGKQAKANERVAHVDRQYICAPIKHRRRSFRLPSSISPT